MMMISSSSSAGSAAPFLSLLPKIAAAAESAFFI